MGKKLKITIGVLVPVTLLALLAFLIRGNSIPVLDPKGPIAEKQLDLLVFASLLSLLVVIPVFILTFWIVHKYRDTNKKTHGKALDKAKQDKNYQPNWSHNTVAETVWWGIPIILIVILGSVIWTSSHELDPYKPLASDKKALEIQVIALPWRWLFIYPEQQIATVNYMPIPNNTPINLTITADSPMNSFWVPQLAGQIYAMSGMSTKLHIMSNETGVYQGSSANLSGEGYADMKFSVNSLPDTTFNKWVIQTKQSTDKLTDDSYAALAKPSKETKQQAFFLEQKSLYDNVVNKYMAPTKHKETASE